MNRTRKSIAVIEFDYHAEVLSNSLQVLLELPLVIHLFTTEKIWKRINFDVDENNFKLYISTGEKEIRRLIKSNLDRINSFDFILFNTLASNFRFFSSIDFKPPVVLRIHNANTYLNSSKSINPKFSFFYIWKDCSYLLLHVLLKQETIYRAKFINSKVDYFLFPSHTIKNYAVSNGLVKPDKVLEPVPYVVMKSFPEKSITDEINIGIIGGIDKRRRNYNEVLDAFRQIVPKLKTRVVLSLLGKPSKIYGKRIIKQFQELEFKNFKVNSFNEFVSQPVFNNLIGKANFLIIPTTKETRYKLYREIYGYTKISGSINDMIIYGKPTIIPEFYPVENSLQPHVGTYKSVQDLISLLEKWIENRMFEDYSFDKIIEDYSFEKVKENTWNNLLNTLKH